MGILRKRPSGPTIIKSSSDALALALSEAVGLKGVKKAGADLLNVSLGELARLGGVQTRTTDTLGLQLAEVATKIIRFNRLSVVDSLNISLQESATSGLISFTSTVLGVDEGTSILISAQRTGGFSGQISVNWGVTGLTEGSPTPSSGTFTWNPGESGIKSASVTFGFVSATRTGVVTLTNPQNLSGGMVPVLVGTNPIAVQVNNTVEYTTAFLGTENPISENGTWRNGSAAAGNYQDGRKQNGRCFGSGFSDPDDPRGFVDNLMVLQGHSVSPEHRVDLTMYREPGYTPPSSHEVEILGCFVIGVGPGGIYARGYEILLTLSGFQVVKWLGTSLGSDNFVFLPTPGNFPGNNTGDVFRGDFLLMRDGGGNIIGREIRIYRNGILFNTTQDTDNPWLDGSMGAGFFIRPGGTPENYCITNWSGRNL